METKLRQIAEKARKNPKEQFSSLVHLINEEMLNTCFVVVKISSVRKCKEFGFAPEDRHICTAGLRFEKLVVTGFTYSEYST